MKKIKNSKLRQINGELTKSFINLLMLLDAEYQSSDKVTDYIFVSLNESLLNGIKALEYHYRDNGANGRVKKHYPKELKTALRLLAKYGENKEKDNVYTNLVLKEKFDASGTIARRKKIKEHHK